MQTHANARHAYSYDERRSLSDSSPPSPNHVIVRRKQAGKSFWITTDANCRHYVEAADNRARCRNTDTSSQANEIRPRRRPFRVRRVLLTLGLSYGFMAVGLPQAGPIDNGEPTHALRSDARRRHCISDTNVISALTVYRCFLIFLLRLLTKNALGTQA